MSPSDLLQKDHLVEMEISVSMGDAFGIISQIKMFKGMLVNSIIFLLLL